MDLLQRLQPLDILFVVVWAAYASSRGLGTESVLGAAPGRVWGVLFLIAVLTILCFYAVVPRSGKKRTSKALHTRSNSHRWDLCSRCSPRPCGKP